MSNETSVHTKTKKSKVLQIKCLFAPTVKQKCTNPHHLFTPRMKRKNYTLQTKGLLTHRARKKSETLQIKSKVKQNSKLSQRRVVMDWSHKQQNKKEWNNVNERSRSDQEQHEMCNIAYNRQKSANKTCFHTKSEMKKQNITGLIQVLVYNNARVSEDFLTISQNFNTD